MKPFDSSLVWWRDEVSQLMQIVHQNHRDQGGTWRTCVMASCTRARAILDDASALDDHAIDRWALKRAFGVVGRSQRLSALESMEARERLRTACFEQCRPNTGDDCP